MTASPASPDLVPARQAAYDALAQRDDGLPRRGTRRPLQSYAAAVRRAHGTEHHTQEPT